MDALEYLAELPALFINVDSSTQKREQFESWAQYVFPKRQRLSAVPILDARAEALEFRKLVQHSMDNDVLDMFGRVKANQAMPKTLEREQKQREYAATYSLYKTTIKAMEIGLEMEWDRFILLEDDAVPRIDGLRAAGPPPASADLAVWGGAIANGAHNHDDKMYAGGKNPEWRQIKNPRGRYMTTAYELTRAGAKKHLEMLQAYPHGTDCSWWYTMASVETHVLQPTGFVQSGPGDRTERAKNGVFMR